MIRRDDDSDEPLVSTPRARAAFTYKCAQISAITASALPRLIQTHFGVVAEASARSSRRPICYVIDDDFTAPIEMMIYSVEASMRNARQS